MRKCRKCNSEMDITIRTIYFEKKIEIKNVPVYSCDNCHHTEVMEQVKEKVKSIILNGNNTYKEIISLEKYSYFTRLLLKAYNERSDSYMDTESREELDNILEQILLEEKFEEHKEHNLNVDLYSKSKLVH